MVESLGCWSASGVELVRRLPRLLSSADRLCGRTPLQMRQWAVEAVSVAIQSGNVEVLLEGHRRSLSERWRRRR